MNSHHRHNGSSRLGVIPSKKQRQHARRRRLFIETLEERRVLAADITYSTDADFAMGSSFNVGPNAVPDQLKLNDVAAAGVAGLAGSAALARVSRLVPHLVSGSVAV